MAGSKGRLRNVHPAGWIVVAVVALAAALLLEAATDSALGAIAVVVALLTVGVARSFYIGDLNRLRRR
jgi:hypothetical protein